MLRGLVEMQLRSGEHRLNGSDTVLLAAEAAECDPGKKRGRSPMLSQRAENG